MWTQAGTINSLVQQATALTEQQADVARQLSSGTRLTSLAADPLAAASSVRLSGSIAQSSATIAVVQATQARLQTADSALASVVDRLTSAVSLAVTGANDTQNTSNRTALASQLSSIRESVLNLANSSYNGSYLFAGTYNAGAPFSENVNTGVISYAGDSGSSTIALVSGTLQTSASGSSLFGTGNASVFATLQSVISTLNTGVAPSSAQVNALRTALQTVIDQRSVLSASASRLEEARSYTATQQTNLQAEQTSVAASDPVALATQLSASQTQRSALLSSLAILGKGSLFDYL